MKIESNFSLSRLKKNFLNKGLTVICIVIIIGLLTQNVYLNTEIDQKNKLEKLRSNINFMDSTLSIVISDIEGSDITNFEIVNNNGISTFKEIFKSHNFAMVAYQNGIVCDPCSDYLYSTWNTKKDDMNPSIYPHLITIGEKLDRKTLIKLKKLNLSSTYFIDKNKSISQQIKLGDFPVNFIFFIDRNMKIIYSTYFTKDIKQHFTKIIDKCIRYSNANN